jgi:pyruvate dehydrogenase E1 component beta subunit
VCGPDIPVPASPPLERWYIPNEERLMAAVRDIV